MDKFEQKHHQKDESMNSVKQSELQCPFFIVGCGRSGTTLLKSIISSHPNLHVMPETFYFRSIHPQLMRYSAEPWRAADFWWLADMGITPETLEPLVKSRLKSGSPVSNAVLEAIFDFHAANERDLVVGEKTPDHVNHIGDIKTCFPNARVIQVVRDPRAVAASFLKVKVGPGSIAEVVAEWARSIEILGRWENKDGYLAIRYEDLVSNPEVILREVCVFLGVVWTPSILNFHDRDDAGFSPEQSHHANTRKPLFNDSVNSWQRELSKSNVNLIEWALREAMERHGYNTVGSEISLPRLRMACSWIFGILHRIFIRAPRQRLKALVARRRQALRSTYN